MVRRSSILASDADRERVGERLRQAAMEGRILASELEERLARALRARTYGELDELVSDLPGPAAPGRSRRRSTAIGLARSHPVAAVAVLVTITLVLFATAAALAFSGVWLLLLVVLVARRGPWAGGPYGGFRASPYRVRGSAYMGRRGRYPYWIR